MLNYNSPSFTGVQVRAIINMVLSVTNSSKSANDDNILDMVANHMISGLKMSRSFYRNQICTNPIAFIVK